MKRFVLIVVLLMTVTSCTDTDNMVIIPSGSLLYELVIENKECVGWDQLGSGLFETIGIRRISGGVTGLTYWGKLRKTLDCTAVNENVPVTKRFVLVEIEDKGLVWVAPDRTIKPDGFLDRF